MTLSRWQVVDIARHGNSWKRAFFEKHVEQTIEEFIPGDTAPVSVEETLEYAAPYVHCIEIKEMLPPKWQSKPKDVRVYGIITIINEYMQKIKKYNSFTHVGAFKHGREKI